MISLQSKPNNHCKNVKRYIVLLCLKPQPFLCNCILTKREESLKQVWRGLIRKPNSITSKNYAPICFFVRISLCFNLNHNALTNMLSEKVGKCPKILI